ncbi:hypothetical protein ACFW17_26440 [Streptomyces sp. NPDC058961]|uniref:hypothetical protein n=1 Tax=Streptomyces sp. NPDC058961 TaxID=3346680 RepID=UPI0036AAD4F9
MHGISWEHLPQELGFGSGRTCWRSLAGWTGAGDRGYDQDKYRRLVWALRVKPVIARRGIEHGSGLGAQHWVVERAFARAFGHLR